MRQLAVYLREWRPAMPGDYLRDRCPAVGAIIALSRKPYRVVEVRDTPAADWTDADREAWREAGEPSCWEPAPFDLLIQPLPSGRIRGCKIPGGYAYIQWTTLPEHYAVCALCLELAPCRHVTAEQTSEVEAARLDQMTAILPGCCWGCAEPITKRQKCLTYHGPNVDLPIAPDNVHFHERKACHYAATEYEERWAAANPANKRTWRTLTCQGALIRHEDETEECIGAQDSTCPHPKAKHRYWTRCRAQTHGCARCGVTP